MSLHKLRNAFDPQLVSRLLDVVEAAQTTTRRNTVGLDMGELHTALAALREAAS